jgi:hypothetical protein
MAPTDRRALIAVLVSVVGLTVGLVGAGHVYLREWRRAFAWFALVLGTGLVLTSIFADPLDATPASLPLTVTLPVLVLVSLSVFDAYSLGQRQAVGGSDPDVPTCPHCGGALDPTLDFCHWCTRPLATEQAADVDT